MKYIKLLIIVCFGIVSTQLLSMVEDLDNSIIEDNQFLSVAGEGAASVGVAEDKRKDRLSNSSNQTDIRAQLEAVTKADPTEQINLVIIDDVSEVTNILEHENFVEQLQKFSEKEFAGPMKKKLLRALLEDQLVLCPDLLWDDIQKIARLMDYVRSASFKPVNQQGVVYRRVIDYMVQKYIQFKTVNNLSVKEFLNNILKGIKSYELDDSYFFSIFCLYVAHDIICLKNYICKRLTKDFILFVPRRPHSHTIPQEFYQDLLDFDYEHRVNQFSDIVEKCQRKRYLSQDRRLGRRLLTALYAWNIEIQKVPLIRQPFFNVMLNGHGYFNMTAGLDIVAVKDKDKKVEKTDFLRFMDFFHNNVRTKTLLISSCFTGGKKNIDAYNIVNSYQNINLERLRYVVINQGIQYSVTQGLAEDLFKFNKDTSFQQIVHLNTDSNSRENYQFDKYFLAINETPPNYTKALESDLLVGNKKSVANNYIVIKLPHTSWFTQPEYGKNVIQLSQVDMITKTTPIVVSADVKLILLGANYIPRKLEMHNSDTIILPFNYGHQNYYFSSLQFAWHSKQIQAIVETNYESTNIVFDKVLLKRSSNDIEVLNFSIFTKKNVSDLGIIQQASNQLGPNIKINEEVSGCAFLLNNNNFVVALFDHNTKQFIKLDAQALRVDIYNQYIAQVKQSVMNSLPPAFKEDFIEDLSNKIAQKDRTLAKIKQLEEKFAKEDAAATKIKKVWKQNFNKFIKDIKNAVEHSDENTIKKMMADTRFKGLSFDDLFYLLQEIAKRGFEDSFNLLIKDPKFSNLTDEQKVKIYGAAQQGHNDAIIWKVVEL